MKKCLFVVLVFALVATLSPEAPARGPRGGGRALGGARSVGSRAGGISRSARPATGLSGSQLRNFGAQGVGSRASSALQQAPRNLGSALQGGASSRLQSAAGLGNRLQSASPQAFQQRLQNAQQVRSQAAQQLGQNLGTAAQQAASTWTSTHAQPFTPAWYLQHPNAWKVTHPYAAPAAAITAAGVAAWLAAPYAAGTGDVVESTTVIVEQPAAEVVEQTQVNQDAYQAGESAPTDQPPAPDTQWMFLGVYTLQAPGETTPMRMVELALGQDGRVAGSHYDRVGNKVEPISGTVDRQTMVVRWTIGTSGQASVFETTLDQLTQPQGKVTVRFPDGATAQWIIAKSGS